MKKVDNAFRGSWWGWIWSAQSKLEFGLRFIRTESVTRQNDAMAGCQLVGNSVFYGTERRNCHCQLVKFSGVPLFYPLLNVPLTNISASLSNEGPPDGYRKNVGICLVNPSKKVLNLFSNFPINSFQFDVFFFLYCYFSWIFFF